MPRPPLGEQAMTAAERQRRYRERLRERHPPSSTESRPWARATVSGDPADKEEIQRLQDENRGLRERISQLEQQLQQQPAPDLSISAQQKLAAAIRRATLRDEAEVQARAQAMAKKLIDEMILPEINEDREMYELVIKHRNGVMDKQTFRQIWACLHPDWMPDKDKKQRNAEAFMAFSKLELVLLNEKEHPTKLSRLPKDSAELRARAERATANRKPKRK